LGVFGGRSWGASDVRLLQADLSVFRACSHVVHPEQTWTWQLLYNARMFCSAALDMLHYATVVGNLLSAASPGLPACPSPPPPLPVLPSGDSDLLAQGAGRI